MFARKSPVLVFQTLISAILGYVSLFFITRYIGPVYWGYLSYAIAFAGLYTIIIDLGFSTAHVKILSSGEDKGKALGTFLAIRGILNAIYVFAVIGTLLTWVYVLHRGFYNPIEFWVILAILPYYAIANMIPIFSTYYSVTYQSSKMAIPPLIEAILRNSIFIFIGVLYYLGNDGNLGNEISVVLALVYGLTYSIFIIISYLLGRPWKISMPSRVLFKKYVSIALPLALATSIAIINGNIDKVLIQFFWGTIATGAFFANQKLTSAMIAISASVYVFFLPLLTSSRHKSAVDFNDQVHEYERIISLVTLPIAISMIWMSPFILNLFNRIFAQYSMSLSILAVGTYFSVLTSPFTSAIISQSKQRFIALIGATSVCVNIVANIILIPTQIFGVKLLGLGVTGASIGFLLGALFAYIAFKEYYRKINGVRTSSKFYLQIVPAIAQSLFLIAAYEYIQPYDILKLLPVVILSLLIYLIISITLKEIGFDEIREIFVGLKMLKEKEEKK
ncbi:MAG: oligosaccharide flippase family protein [Thermoplasmataceae archaeon]